MHDRLIGAQRTLMSAPAHQIVEHLSEYLTKQYAVATLDLFQVDYRLSELVPLNGGPAVTHPGAPAWRAFDHLTEVEDGTALWLPVAVRGDRLGVVRITPAPDEEELRAELAEIADLLGHALAAAREGTDRYAVAARTKRLTLAAEMQWGLLPGRGRTGSAFAMAGQLEPAYAVRGDTFDWSDDLNRLQVVVVNGHGEGVAAAALSCLAMNALRNARRAGLDVADQATLADQAIYSYHRGAQHIDALMLDLELKTGVVTAVDAGSPRLLRLRDGEVSPITLDAQDPLGMFDGTMYAPQTFTLEPGDRLFVVSDGIVDATSRGTRYGESLLDRFLARSGALSPLAAVRSVIGDLRAFIGGETIDDAVAVCLDWTPPGPGDDRGRA
ncbi:serine phosphatase RsbU (regulator of sigma subunit) [Catenuloplanes nepalensis]|uniref:Serine phosphatase RsbU (Regulator of sigma subunit) n=1 Tax=Catenuloplanes nepalensis TaxID=587533 RepID=A0ABT9MVD1_9ACTN|nr:PP2C family protein-serine/threonine phosphatase [Catenuloplanes nepalensis]MDP9795334.1 serine phosphatase RsbU (regulator of sigma subunit) [Catenuloplanes nepalensis]